MTLTSRLRQTLPRFILSTACALGAGCSSLPEARDSTLDRSEPELGAAVAPQPDGSLYQALGGAAGIESLSRGFIRAIAADERIREHFRDTDISRFHSKLQEQLCQISGGGCEYSGDSMIDSHAGLGIDRVDFNAVVEALMKAMDQNRIPVSAQNRLLAALAPMHGEIVEE